MLASISGPKILPAARERRSDDVLNLAGRGTERREGEERFVDSAVAFRVRLVGAEIAPKTFPPSRLIFPHYGSLAGKSRGLIKMGRLRMQGENGGREGRRAKLPAKSRVADPLSAADDGQTRGDLSFSLPFLLLLLSLFPLLFFPSFFSSFLFFFAIHQSGSRLGSAQCATLIAKRAAFLSDTRLFPALSELG